MRRITAIIVLGAAMGVTGIIATSAAQAEDGPPAILILEGKINELEATISGTTGEIVTNEGKQLTAGAVKCTLGTFKTSPVQQEKDANVGVGDCDWEKVKTGTVGCRSETSGGTKDPFETILMLLDLRIGAGVSGGVLLPYLISTWLGKAGEVEAIMNCGGVKDKVKGTSTCFLLPGLKQQKALEPFEWVCKQKGGKDEFGTCLAPKEACELAEKEPFEAELGAKFEQAAVGGGWEVKFDKDVFLDD